MCLYGYDFECKRPFCRCNFYYFLTSQDRWLLFNDICMCGTRTTSVFSLFSVSYFSTSERPPRLITNTALYTLLCQFFNFLKKVNSSCKDVVNLEYVIFGVFCFK